MRRLSDTIERLAAFKAMAPSLAGGLGGRLKDLGLFGTNPGALVGKTHIPDGLPNGAPLVVVLHGCTQTAESYDRGSGWSDLADRAGFALLYPEQTRANNPNLCFNWFQPEDTRREGGEALSIRQMIDTMSKRYAIDSRRVFVTGLSAGGAMASVMLATYPEVFAGGAVIAGLPYGSAGTVPEAFDRMRNHGSPSAADLQRLLRGASTHDGPWPTLSIWHGDADRTVAYGNVDRIVDQWRDVHGLENATGAVDLVDGQVRRSWRNPNGRTVVESYTIAGMGHGTPLATTGADSFGTSGPFMLEAGISSTVRIAESWGIVTVELLSRSPKPTGAHRPDSEVPRPLRVTSVAPSKGEPEFGVKRTIEDALRSAGLMR